MKPKREKFWEGIMGKTMGRESFWPQDGSKETTMWGWKGVKANARPVPSGLRLWSETESHVSSVITHETQSCDRLQQSQGSICFLRAVTGKPATAPEPSDTGLVSQWGTVCGPVDFKASCYSVLFLSLLALYFTFLISFKIKHLFKVFKIPAL